jgi:hypothetical protein
MSGLYSFENSALRQFSSGEYNSGICASGIAAKDTDTALLAAIETAHHSHQCGIIPAALNSMLRRKIHIDDDALMPPTPLEEKHFLIIGVVVVVIIAAIFVWLSTGPTNNTPYAPQVDNLQN